MDENRQNIYLKSKENGPRKSSNNTIMYLKAIEKQVTNVINRWELGMQYLQEAEMIEWK